MKYLLWLLKGRKMVHIDDAVCLVCDCNYGVNMNIPEYKKEITGIYFGICKDCNK